LNELESYLGGRDKIKLFSIIENNNPQYGRGLLLGLDYYRSEAVLAEDVAPMPALSAPVPQPTKTEMLVIKSTIALIFFNNFIC
jgi:hypothetical protein